MTEEFPEFPKIARLSRDCTISEKIDGTNVLIEITEEMEPVSDDCQTTCPTGKLAIRVGSRTRWITTENDHHGFAKWALDNSKELLKLGVGRHYGEWWGSGIQKRYMNQPKTFSLFNTYKWGDATVRPTCCSVVPVIYSGIFTETCVSDAILTLKKSGSLACPGCMRPEGIVIWHNAAQTYFKKTLEKDEEWKGKK